MIVVPAIWRDRAGNRLGYGLGYYDRLLASYALYKGDTACVIYDFQLFDHLPAEEHDIPVRHIFTEKQVISVEKINK